MVTVELSSARLHTWMELALTPTIATYQKTTSIIPRTLVLFRLSVTLWFPNTVLNLGTYQPTIANVEFVLPTIVRSSFLSMLLIYTAVISTSTVAGFP